MEVASASGAGASGADASAPPPESDVVSKDLPIKKRNRNSEKSCFLRNEFSFIYFIQHYLCNDFDCLQTGRYRMLHMFRKISDVLRLGYKKCNSNIAMRGCSAPAQKNMHFIFSINHAISSYFAAIISDNIHSLNQKIFHERRIHRS